jgi:c-di-GMP-binding flagellar brake protein YcgR
MSTFNFFNVNEKVIMKLLDPEKEYEYSCSVKDIHDNSLTLKICNEDNKACQISLGTKVIISGEGSNFNFDIPAKIVEHSSPSTLKLKKIGLRAHLRMNVMILLKYRKLTTKEYGNIEKIYTSDDKEEWFSQSFFIKPFMEDVVKEEETGNIDRFIINALIDINLKLNLIHNMLSSEEETSIFKQKPMEVNISESGVGFNTKEKVRKGTILELKILLPIFPIAIIKAWGKVVRSTPLPEGGWIVGVQYIDIKEEDQDKIVHYIFKKQRELLRNKKSLMEVDGQ